MDFAKTPEQSIVEKTIKALEANNMVVHLVQNKAEAKAKVLELVTPGSDVMTNPSVTLESIDVLKEIDDSGKYNSHRNTLVAGYGTLDPKEKKRLGAVIDFTLGSVHAITENGQVVIASNTGSQLGGYAYSALKVIWVVSTTKIVSDLDSAFKRIYDYVLPLEKVHMKEKYGPEATSNVSKLLIVNREKEDNRIHIVLVNEKLGF